MRIKVGQDFDSGLLFVAVGVAGLWLGADYPMGTAQRPGTGVLPRILAWCLIAIGVLLGLRSAFVEGPRLTGWAWRPAVMITVATIAFALLVDRAGLIPTMAVSLTLAALGTPETRWREYLLFLLIMMAIGILVFIKALGMPIPLWPTGTNGWSGALLDLLRAR